MTEKTFATFVGVFDDAIDEFKEAMPYHPKIHWTGPHTRLTDGEKTVFYIEGPEFEFFNLLSDLGYSHDDFDTLTIVELSKE